MISDLIASGIQPLQVRTQPVKLKNNYCGFEKKNKRVIHFCFQNLYVIQKIGAEKVQWAQHFIDRGFQGWWN